MPQSTDTIVAIATPPGRGGLAVVRLSGADAMTVARRVISGARPLKPRRAHKVTLLLANSPAPMDDAAAVRQPGRDELRDEAVVTWFPGPESYTGEDVVELSLHGSPLLAARCVAAAVAAGARGARAGEFTLRAFLNGKLDLAQAEAVQDLVSATTPAQARMAFDQLQGTLSERLAEIDQALFSLAARLEASIDFPDEGYHFVEPGEAAKELERIAARIGALLADSRRGRVLREGATVAVAGRTNVGKSTVFNRLAGSERAIVTAVPGTTRDLITETVTFGGVPASLVDTAGARATSDPVEREGVSRAAKARRAADLVILVLDGSCPLTPEDLELLGETAGRPRVIAANKSDLPPRWSPEHVERRPGETILRVSALFGDGMDELANTIAGVLGVAGEQELPAVSNVRHVELLERARSGLGAAIAAIESSLGHLPEELVLLELQEARDALEEVTGRRSTETLLAEIFSRFCVGK